MVLTHVADAVGQLVRQHRMRIHYLPGDPTRSYTVRAPALITQLDAVIAASNRGSGGRTIPGSRLPLDATAWDLWCDITTTVHTWARDLGVNRRPFLEQDRADRAAAERVPDWQRALRPWLRPVIWDQPIEDPKAAPAATNRESRITPAELNPLPLEGPGHIDPTLPALGRLLRAASATAAGAGHDLVAAAIARKSWCGDTGAPADCRHGCWAHRIEGILAATVEDREIRGAACWECRTQVGVDDQGEAVMAPTRTVLLHRDGERYRAPAIVMRVAQLPVDDGDEDQADGDLWVYRMCRACGAEGWMDYTTQTGGPTSPPGDLDPTDARRAELRAAAVAARRAREAMWAAAAAPGVLAGVTTKDHEERLKRGAA